MAKTGLGSFGALAFSSFVYDNTSTAGSIGVSIY
jgi:hypothetical protein